MTLGVCLLRASGEGGGTSVRITGAGGTLSVAIGGALNQHLVLFGEVLSASGDKRSVVVDGVSVDANSGQIKIAALGGGVAYYLASNLYFSGSLLVPQIQPNVIEASIGGGQDKFGLGLEAMIGKEWWVSSNWGLGLAVQVLYARSTEDRVPSSTWQAWGATLVGSATFN
jgi:hypothetical protein